MLELVDVKKYFKNNRAVDGVSFHVGKGEILALIGANGAGKTTTLSMIATLIKPDSGGIYFDRQDVISNPELLRNNLGYVPQEIALYPTLSGYDNLCFWGKANHIYGKRLKQRIDEVSKIINMEEAVLNKKISSYSGGMKRRLNIGAALLHEPMLIIMDEPTVGLDVESRNQILDTVMELKKCGAAIVYSGHYMEEMEKICDKICIIDKGKCILFGSKKELLSENKGLEQLLLEAIRRQ
ncbi:MAG: ABC transporter ATP-binding protein [Herbinix sp.]|nr:ABC transporter ATP-binding protein [Herbinix sp.]